MGISAKIFKYSGVAAALIYLPFTIAAFVNFPETFGPFSNWLSDLGNPLRNPSGAAIYNTGCIITAILLLVFFIGIFKWTFEKRKIKIPAVIAQAFGIITALTIIIASLYPLGIHTGIHSLISFFTYLALDTFESFLAISLFLNPKISKWIPVFCYAAAVSNLITQGFLGLYLGEWMAILMLMLLMVIVLSQYNKLTDAQNQERGGTSQRALEPRN